MNEGLAVVGVEKRKRKGQEQLDVVVVTKAERQTVAAGGLVEGQGAWLSRVAGVEAGQSQAAGVEVEKIGPQDDTVAVINDSDITRVFLEDGG